MVTANNPYINANWSSGGAQQQRCCCASLRIRYAGTELNRGGSIIMYVAPDHSDTTGFNPASALAYQGVATLPVKDREWVTCTWVPVHMNELDYIGAPYPPSGGNSTMSITALVNSTASNVFEYEYIQHHEIIGASVGEKSTTKTSSKGQTLLGAVRGSVANYAGQALTDYAKDMASNPNVISTIISALGVGVASIF